MWIPDLAGRTGLRYRAIAEAITEAIAEGTLADGARLPPQRDVAHALGMSLGTVTRAYAEAERRGLVRGEVGRGTYVRGHGPLPAGAPVLLPTGADAGSIDLTMNLPPLGEGAGRLGAALAEMSRDPDLAVRLDVRATETGAGAAGAAWIGRLGLEVPASAIVPTVGAQNGILACLMATARPGDGVLTESLTYPPVKQMARHLDLRPHPVAMDGHGLLPEALDAACFDSAARVLYCMPTLHSPTTATMPEERRRDIAEVARRHALTIIEDDVFGFLPMERPPPLAAFAPERTLLVTSVSKTLGPGFRIGYVAAPGALRDAVRTAVGMSCWMAPPLTAEIVRRWIADGTADSLRQQQRTEARARQGIAASALWDFHYRADPCGLHVWLSVPEPGRADAVRQEAERRGVKVLDGGIFAVGRAPVPQALRLSLGNEPSRERLAVGLDILAGLLAERQESALTVV